MLDDYFFFFLSLFVVLNSKLKDFNLICIGFILLHDKNLFPQMWGLGFGNLICTDLQYILIPISCNLNLIRSCTVRVNCYMSINQLNGKSNSRLTKPNIDSQLFESLKFNSI